MRIVAFRHVPFEGCGTIHHAVEGHGAHIEYADLYRAGAAIPDAASADALIFMGGPMSVNDPLGYLECEMTMIREAVERRQPVLGICLGSQLIAKALGATVGANPVKEIGWYDIRLTEAGRADPLFAGAQPVETVFHWHGETFGLPKGAALLASSDACAHQAVRFTPTTYGMQFHLEVTPAMIADWCCQSENCGDVAGLTAPLDARAHDMTRLAATVFGNWYGLLSLGR